MKWITDLWPPIYRHHTVRLAQCAAIRSAAGVDTPLPVQESCRHSADRVPVHLILVTILRIVNGQFHYKAFCEVTPKIASNSFIVTQAINMQDPTNETKS